MNAQMTIGDAAKEGFARSNLAMTLRKLRRLDGARQEIRRAITENETAHASILDAFRKAGTEPHPLTTKGLAQLAQNVESLQRQLETKLRRQEELRATTSIDAKVKAMMRGKDRSLSTEQKMGIARTLLRGIVLDADNIVLDRRNGGTIVGMLKKREGTLSHSYRFMDVEWLG